MNSDIKDKFLKRVKYKDKRIESFEADFNRWFGGFSKDEQTVVEVLLDNFDYYSLQFVNEQLHYLYNKLKDDYHVRDIDAAFTHIKKSDGKDNSSNQYYVDFKRINNVNGGNCFDDIERIEPNEWPIIKKIVIIDDICGTGGTLDRYLELTNLDFSGKTIYYIVIHALQVGKDYLKCLEEKYNTEIVLISMNTRIKALDIETIRDTNAKEIIEEFSKLNGLNKKYWMGYNDSQGLVAFYNNTPNNTLGLFWDSTDFYKSIFPRVFSEAPSWSRPTIKSMNEGRKNRKKANYMSREKDA